MSSTLKCKCPANSVGCHAGTCGTQTQTTALEHKSDANPKLHNDVQSCSKFYSRDTAKRKGLIYIYTDSKCDINFHHNVPIPRRAIFTQTMLQNILRFVNQVIFSRSSQNLKGGKKNENRNFIAL